ncbi:MAG: HAMP domain-containing histidine kinase [Bryobacteraceae bacterium]|nr:HAMP domain-containing histidine kinase [Bryobacteraceae bacterium]
MTDAAELPVSGTLERGNAWFIKLRWVAAIAVAVAAAMARYLGLFDLPVGPILCVAAGLVVYNAVLFSVARRFAARPVDQDWGSAGAFARLLAPRTFLGLGGESRVASAALFAFAQITLDFCALALLLHFTGGVESPFSAFFAFHIVIASILLSRRATYLQATIGLLLFAGVVLGEFSGLMDHHSLGWVWAPAAYRQWSVAAAYVAVLGVTLYLASYLCSTIAVDLRERVRVNVLLSRQIRSDKRQLETAYEILAKTERSKSEYMRKVAHELRGPLGTIETALKVVLQGMAGALGEPARELIDRARRRAGELAAVTRDLLLLASAREASPDERFWTPVALDALVAEVIEDFRGEAERKGLTLSTGAAAGGVVLGEAVAMRQLVANLVENGIRYTPPGGFVTVQLRPRAGCWELEVQDTGIGISAQDQPKVFDEFYRGANARVHASEGTGLGLSIVRAIAERHGGSIAVESELGHGTRFAVTLPGAEGDRC